MARFSDASDQMSVVSTKIDVLRELSKKTPSAIIELRSMIMSQNAVSSSQVARISQNCDEIRDRVDSLSLSAAASQGMPERLSRALIGLFWVIRDIKRLLSM